jgi:hypothetical protein
MLFGSFPTHLLTYSPTHLFASRVWPNRVSLSRVLRLASRVLRLASCPTASRVSLNRVSRLAQSRPGSPYLDGFFTRTGPVTIIGI